MNYHFRLFQEELIPWVVPNEANTISNEAMHLLSQADGNMVRFDIKGVQSYIYESLIVPWK